MPKPLPDPGSPADWLRHARSDLVLAQIEQPEGVLSEALCFHAQQAAEKALKAVLVHLGRDVPHTHDIEALNDLLAEVLEVPEAVVEADRLTTYAVLTRYPADVAPVSEGEYREAVRQAEVVFAWATSAIYDSDAQASSS